MIQKNQHIKIFIRQGLIFEVEIC